MYFENLEWCYEATKNAIVLLVGHYPDKNYLKGHYCYIIATASTAN